MRDIKKEVEELFNNMSDDEFDNMLSAAGFEFEYGKGEVVYKDNDEQFKYKKESTSVSYKVKTTFKLNQKIFTTKEETKINSFSFRSAC